MNNVRTLLLIGSIIFLSGFVHAAAIDYLILEDIGEYRLFTGVPGRVFSGPPSKYSQTATGGVLNAVGHFSEGDVSYEASYKEPDGKWPFITVEVTQHSGADSDKWLLHEVDTDFRNYFGIPGRAYGPRQIDGQTILEDSVGGANYRWLSGSKVIMIEYHDSQMTKPEPMEVVRVYLTKHLSTLPPIRLVDLRSAEYKTTWIKDEMERRLWLCDKWFVRVQLGKSELNKILDTLVKNMFIFLDYREKYYGLTAKDEKIALVGYLSAKDGASVKSKLTEYKIWWNVNKTKPINLR